MSVMKLLNAVVFFSLINCVQHFGTDELTFSLMDGQKHNFYLRFSKTMKD